MAGPAATNWLWWEDFAVGQTFRSGPMGMTAERIVAFAREFDPQPQHLGAVASDSLFGELVASGWHTAAVTTRLMVGDIMGRFKGGGMGLGIEQISWPAPVRPGDTLMVENEVTALRPSRSRPDRGILTVRSTTRNQHGRVVQVMTGSMLVPRRPEAGQGSALDPLKAEP